MSIRAVLRFWLPPLLWTGVIFAASGPELSSPHTASWLAEALRFAFGHVVPEPLFHVLHFAIRKAGHLIEYGILGAFLFRAIRGERAAWGWRWAAAAIALAAVVGALDEWHQAFVPFRTSSPWDVLIDAAGAALAQILIRIAQVLFFRS